VNGVFARVAKFTSMSSMSHINESAGVKLLEVILSGYTTCSDIKKLNPLYLLDFQRTTAES